MNLQKCKGKTICLQELRNYALSMMKRDHPVIAKGHQATYNDKI
jgi:hypothetical protein